MNTNKMNTLREAEENKAALMGAARGKWQRVVVPLLVMGMRVRLRDFLAGKARGYADKYNESLSNLARRISALGLPIELSWVSGPRGGCGVECRVWSLALRDDQKQ